MSGGQAQIEQWSGDDFSRAREASVILEYLFRRLDDREKADQARSFVLNIDAPWGDGKTFFLNGLAQSLQNDGYLVAQVNAWVDDYADDPLISVLSAIEVSLAPYLKKSAKLGKLFQQVRARGFEIAISFAKHSGSALSKRYLGAGIEEVIGEGNTAASVAGEVAEKSIDDLIDSEAAKTLERFRKTKHNAENFSSQVSAVIEQLGEGDLKHRQLFVLIDELDRCRPLYAISVLERVKHLFDTSGLVFILATDTSQLQHSIKAVYGEGFDSRKYLLRFFDRQYHFTKPNKVNLIRRLRSERVDLSRINIPPMTSASIETKFDIFFSMTSDGFKLSLRDTSAAFDLFTDFASSWRYASLIELAYLLPLICAKLGHGTNLGQLNVFSSNRDRQVIADGLAWGLGETTNRNGSPINPTALQYFDILYTNRSIDLRQANQSLSNPGDPITSWGRSCFADEFQRIHKGQFNFDTPIPSVLQHYASVVDSLGNFTA